MNQNGNSTSSHANNRSSDFALGTVLGISAAVGGAGTYILAKKCVKWIRAPESRPTWFPGYQPPSPPLGEVFYPRESLASPRPSAGTGDRAFRYLRYEAPTEAERLLLKRPSPPDVESQPLGFFERMSRHAQKYFIPESDEQKKVRFSLEEFPLNALPGQPVAEDDD